MLGKKYYQPKLFTEFNLSDRIPEHNFYRRLKAILNLDFLQEKTKAYYGICGQKSIDPAVIFKLMLVGYLENIISDRQLIQHCSMRLDILYFLEYDIDAPRRTKNYPGIVLLAVQDSDYLRLYSRRSTPESF